jgi:hypothetical protein
MARKTKTVRDVRKWFTAAITANGDEAVLDPRKGARIVTVEIGPDGVTETPSEDARARLYVNRGDRLIVCGPSVDETFCAVVTHIEQDGYRERLRVLLGGELQPNTKTVHVLRGPRAA